MRRLQIRIIRTVQAILVIAVALSYIHADWASLFASTLTLFATFLPAIMGRNVRLHLPLEFHFFIVLFAFATLFLGEVAGFYERLWWWDLALHSVSAVGFGIVGFVILYTLYDSKRFVAQPFVGALFTFTFAIAIGALWEIFEFTMDSLFGLNMQKSGLRDTMSDLIVDSIGAFVSATVAYLYIVRRGHGSGYLHRLIRRSLVFGKNVTKE
jgi:hypothetical protein